jgi:hypothetical protein
MQDVMVKNNSIASRSIVGGVAMSRKRSYDTDGFEAFKVESTRKAAKVEKDHLACLNDFQIQIKKIKAQHAYKLETMVREDSDYIKKITALNEKIHSDQLKTIEIQKSTINKMESAHESAFKLKTDLFNEIKSTNNLLHNKNLELNEKLASATMKSIKYVEKSVAVRDELDNLRYILEVGEDPVRGPAFCPVSRNSLLRNDTVAVFEGDCNCNSMVKQSVSGPCIDNFNDGSDVRCLNCFSACGRIVLSTVANATSTNSWRKIEKLTGCGDFESVSIRNSTILEKRLADQKAIDTKNIRDCVKQLMK